MTIQATFREELTGEVPGAYARFTDNLKNLSQCVNDQMVNSNVQRVMATIKDTSCKFALPSKEGQAAVVQVNKKTPRPKLDLDEKNVTRKETAAVRAVLAAAEDVANAQQQLSLALHEASNIVPVQMFHDLLKISSLPRITIHVTETRAPTPPTDSTEVIEANHLPSPMALAQDSSETRLLGALVYAIV